MTQFKTLFVIPAFVFLFSCSHTHPINVATEMTADAKLVRQHMAILADDEMQGREAGTAGYDRAAAYVAQQFQQLGLTPGGSKGRYFQPVPLRRSFRNEKQVVLNITDENGQSLPLENTKDYHVSGSLGEASTRVSAQAVFVGYGLVAPELNRDDYQGLDVNNKVVVMLAGTPEGIQSEERAFYGSRKAKEASQRGAIGVVTLYTPVRETIYAFARIQKEGRMNAARMGWIQADGKVYSNAPNIKAAALFSMNGAAKLFADTEATWTQILEAVADPSRTIPRFEMPMQVTIEQSSILDELTSDNVLGVIEGSDPVLKHQALVLTAHLDGLGISQIDEPDRINNGALDNAAGVATLLETARIIMQGPRPRRSIVFFANTAEEKGLLGAEYFVQNPTTTGLEVVGNINLDMPVLTYDFKDVVVFGGERSSLRGAIKTAAEHMGLTIGPDPFPEQGVFTRSDHFRFVEAGVPSVMLATGMENGGEKAWAEHFAKHYHRPSDDMNNTINFAAAAKFAELKTRITLQVANADQRPLWHKGDFFARQFNGPMAED